MNNQRSRTENPALSSILPHDLIVQILLRLPVRSLLRFKSVCKSWLSLISDPEFGKSHFDLAAAPTHRYHLTIINDSEVESRDIDGSFRDDAAVVRLKFPPPFDQLDSYTRGNCPYFLGSCRGFILVIYDSGNTVIWNPSTGFQRRIAGEDHLGKVTFEYLTGFGYDTSTDDYLLVYLDPIHLNSDPIDNYEADYNSIEYFSLRTNSWTPVEGVSFRYAYIDAYSRIGSLLNEALHWLVIEVDTKLQVIIAFDLVERSLSEIHLSNDLARRLEYNQYYLRVIGGCLSLYYPGEVGSMAEIWMMTRYKVQSSWSMVFVFSTCNIPRNVFYPIYLTKDCEILGSNGSGRLMILNCKGWLVDQCTFCPEPDKGQYIQADSGMYRETLLSLPNVFEEACDGFEEASEDDQLTSSSEEASEDDQ